jgi:hypothetical protein
VKLAAALAVLAILLYTGGTFLLLAAPSTPPAGAGIGGCYGNAVVATVGAGLTFHMERRARP